MALQYSARRRIYGRIETSYANASDTIAGSDAVETFGVDLTPAEVTSQPKEFDRQFFGAVKDIPVSTRTMVNFSAFLSGAGTAGNEPRVGRFLRGCGYSQSSGASGTMYAGNQAPSASTKSITGAASGTDGTDLTVGSSHGYNAGEWVTVTGTTDYNGTWEILSTGSTTIEIEATYTSSQSGSADVPGENGDIYYRTASGSNAGKAYTHNGTSWSTSSSDDYTVPSGASISTSSSIPTGGSDNDVHFQTGLVGGWIWQRNSGAWRRDESAVGYSYWPVSGSFASMVIRAEVDQLMSVVRGCRGGMTFGFSAEELPRIDCQFQGLYSAMASVSTLTPSFGNQADPVGVNNENTPLCQLFGTDVVMSQMNVNLNSQVQYFNDPGREAVEIMDRAPSGQLVMELDSVISTNNFPDLAAQGSEGEFIARHGTVAGNIFDAVMPRVQIMNPTITDGNGRLMLQCDLKVLPSSLGNDELILRFR